MHNQLKCALALIGALGWPAALIGAASAGGYDRTTPNGIVETGGASCVLYSSGCCYTKVVRHSRSVRYVPVRRYRQCCGYGYHQARRLCVQPYRVAPYVGHQEPVVAACYFTRVRIPDGRGGWVRGKARVCNSADPTSSSEKSALSEITKGRCATGLCYAGMTSDQLCVLR